jgi:DNA-binding NtrC family response regulator
MPGWAEWKAGEEGRRARYKAAEAAWLDSMSRAQLYEHARSEGALEALEEMERKGEIDRYLGALPTLDGCHVVSDHLQMTLYRAEAWFRRVWLQAQIQRYGGNISRVAKAAGLTRSACHVAIRRLGIKQELITRARSARRVQRRRVGV